MICTRCGHNNPVHLGSCERCGQSLGAPVPPAYPQAAPPPLPPPPGPPPFPGSMPLPPGYHRAPDITIYVVLTVLLFFCCQPMAFVSIVFVLLAHSSGTSGNYVQAESYLRTARICLWLGYGFVVVAPVIYLLLACFLGMMGAAAS